MARLIAILAGVAGAWLGWCAPAGADPISVGILSALGYAGAGGLLAPTAVLGSLLLNSALAALPGILLATGLSVGATLLLNAFRPQPTQPTPGERMVNLRQPVQARDKSYGRVRKGGPVSFWKPSSGARYVDVLFNTGEIDAYEAFYLDETQVSLDGSGFVTNDQFNPGGVPAVTIEAHRGAAGQTSSPALSAAFPEWTSAHVLAGIAHAVAIYRNVDAEDFASVYTGGREPTLTALIRGTKCYDPRTGTTVWTTNAALVLADWIVSADGLGKEVDWELVATEADVADTAMTDRDGNPIKKWELCGTYGFDQPRDAVRTQMATACDAYFYETDDGKVGFFLGRWMEPEVTIADAHIISGQLSEGQDGTSRPNAISIQYTEPAAGYREAQSAAFYEADGEAYSEETLQALWAPKHTQAVMIAKRALRAARAQYDVQLKLNLYGLVLRDKRTFRLEWNELGVSATFEVASWSFGDDGLSVTVTGKSVIAADYAFSAATEEPAPNTIADVTTDATIPDPENVMLSSDTAGAITVSWDAPVRSGLVARVRYRAVGASDWMLTAPAFGATTVTVAGLAADDYEAEAQWRTAALQSNWVASDPTSVTVS